MEATAVILVAFLLLLGGAVVLWSRQDGMTPRSWMPRLPASDGVAPRKHVAEGAMALPVAATATTITAVSPPPQTSPAASSRAPGDLGLQDSPRRNTSLVAAESWNSLDSRLERIEQAITNLERAERHHFAAQPFDLRQVVAELTALVDADLARREIAIERLRADLVSAIAAQRKTPPLAESGRPRACVELYARLAGLETALGAVTNPMLLPGETYSPPPDLFPETLVWDNWNEVGERAFAFGETYSAERLHLSGDTRHEISAFVTQLRTFLTGSVYPNMHTDPSPDEVATLRLGLADIAVALPQVREALEREFRQG